MANKINEEHMAKMFGGFGLTCNTPVAPKEQSGKVQSVSVDTENTVTKEPQSNKKKKKTDRVSFMCRISESNLLKIRILSATSGKSLSDFIDASITEYLQNHESEYGNILARVQ